MPDRVSSEPSNIKILKNDGRFHLRILKKKGTG
ncbi:hypothetical protein BN1864_LIB5394:02993 [Pseudomonas sp. 1 R 17]|nr:hypothetical protein BN1864_LIB5394:02993 [Pseudomonas sp. 1 R 17]